MSQLKYVLLADRQDQSPMFHLLRKRRSKRANKKSHRAVDSVVRRERPRRRLAGRRASRDGVCEASGVQGVRGG